ncbi:MAG: lysylphosphatidylglycerol synthase transmembrane domain-containing protein [bacterium]
MRRFSHFAFLFGLALFGFILWKIIDLKTSWDLLEKSRWPWVAAGLLSILPEVCFKGLRFKLMASHFPSSLSFKNACAVYLSGQPLSILTPSKLGDIVRVWGISRWGKIKMTSAFAIHVADKVYDLMALGLFAATGLIVLIARSRGQAPALTTLSGIVLGVLLTALFFNPQWMRAIVRPALLFLAPQKVAKKLKTHAGEFYENLITLFRPSSRVAWPFALSLGAWCMAWWRAYFCALALGIPLSFGKIVLLMPIVVVVEFLPITILGFGIREAALFFFFASPEVSNSALLSFSILNMLVGPVPTALLGVPFAVRLSSALTEKP